ncbi:MAG: gliding motility-associated C-terminal domain-containing protein [Candidatus Competibacteraceae bacterium]|nr:gliding motility-associated C-terminal domain-containing protein [Candidatus Competibacteraceae bacterium]
MKRLFFLVFCHFIICHPSITAQSENCSGAVTLSVMANCSSPVTGNTGLSQNIPGCVGNADDDVWYQFVATSTSHQIVVTPSAGLDPVVQLFSGPCSTLISVSCMDATGTGQSETIFANNLTIGATYRIRIYDYYPGGGSPNTFTICITTPPPPPSNDACGNAISLTINSACTYTNATSLNASQSLPGCIGTADDDVWFSFVATNSVHTITVDPSITMDPVVQLFSGSGCGSLVSLVCMDNTFTDMNEVISAVGLTVGATYYVRVYDYYASTGGAPFQICVTGTPTPTPPNDDPCGAIALPSVTSACSYLNFSTANATTSSGPGIPTPSSCSGGSAPQQGGFNNVPQPKDVWFSIVVPSTGNITITAQPGFGINDVVMALYSGNCTSLTQIACSDDYNYPGSANDLKPFINASGLTPGSTVFLRYWAFNGSTTGNIGFCVSTNTHDNCPNALYICDLNGYSGTTSAAFTVDRPCNMRGLAETNNPPTYTYTPGTCQGGIFGLGGAWGVGAPACDVRIDNNSWIRFTASNTTAILNVTVSNCFVGNYPSGGIQMQIFSAGSACCDFTPVSDFKEGSGTFTITANNLTIGQDYYLVIDGYAGDICSYTITANAGVQFPDITASANPICSGSTITLFGPPGASSYAWQPGGQTTQDITVTPSTTTTYSLEVTGVCGARQTLTKTITVNQLPEITTNNNLTVCATQPINFTASGGVTYSWAGPNGFTSNIQNPSILNAAAVHAGTYTVTVTSANGCTNTANVQVAVNSNPSASIAGTQIICSGQSSTFTASAASSYLWNTGANSQSISVSVAGTYTVTVTGANGCTATATRTLTVNSNPSPVAFNNGPVCVGSNIQLNSGGGVSYSWTGPSSFSSSTQNPTIPGATLSHAGTYTVTVTDSNACTATTSTTVSVVNNPAAAITALPDSVICAGESVTLVANTSSAYLWSTGESTNSIVVSPGVLTQYTVSLTNPGGCLGTADASIWIVVNSLPTANVNANSPVCEGSTILLSSSGGLSFEWSGPNGFISGFATPEINNASSSHAGNYTVTITDANGCTDDAVVNVSVVVNPPIAIIVSPNDSICEGELITLTTSTTGTNYEWHNGASTPSIQLTPSSSSSYTVTVTNPSGICQGTVTAEIFVTVLSLPNPEASDNSPVCPRDIIQLSASGGLQYAWAGPNGFNANIANPNIADATVANAGVYTVVVTNANGCTATATTSVSLYDLALTLHANNDTASVENPNQTTIYFLNNDNGNIESASIISGPSNGFASINGNIVTYTPDDGFEGNDMITYLICDEYCDEYCDTATILIIVSANYVIVVPELVTPNGDGSNDTFVITHIDKYPENELIILNRWGDKIFVAQPYNNDWYGQSNTGLIVAGQTVTNGTYFIVLTLEPGKDPIKGFVELRK